MSSKQTKYVLLSLPSSIVPSHHRDDALEAIRNTVSDYGTVNTFPIPEFKIGTLDALVQQADELARVEGLCQGVVGKVGEALRTVLEGDEEQLGMMKMVNDSMDYIPFRGGLGLGVRQWLTCLDNRAGGAVPTDVLVE